MNTKTIAAAILVATTLASNTTAMTDLDGDGLFDLDEQRLGTDPTRPDSDADGLSDGEEAHGHGTDPLGRDTDGDGLWDATEIRGDLDALDPDTDGDGIQDGEDRCPADPAVREDCHRPTSIRGSGGHRLVAGGAHERVGPTSVDVGRFGVDWT